MIFILFITIVLGWLIVRQYQKCSRLPPGPLSLPLIGNLPQVVYYLYKTGGIVPTLDHFRKQYGNVFTIWFGPLPHVNIADFEIAHEVFVKNGSKYADKFNAPIFTHVRNGYGVISTNGEDWQDIRRFSLHVFRNMGVGRDLIEERIMDELNATCADIDKKAEDGVTIQDAAEFFDLTVGSIINSMLNGSRFEEHNVHEFLTLKKLIDEAMEAFAPLDLTLPVWMLKLFFPRRFRLIVDIQKNAMEFASREAVKRLADARTGKRHIDPDNFQDFSDAFIHKICQEDKNGGSRAFSEDGLKTILLDLWITGQETTSTTLISAFNQMLNHPNVMKKCREELQKVTNNNNRSLTLADKNDTPYLNATISEVQRHASILNVNFWRLNHEFTTMGGHPVDAGALVAAQLSILHTNDEIFKDYAKFDPSRFIENEKLIQQVIPFGVGKRSCLGESLAKSELYLILGNLLLRYHFESNGELPTTDDVMPFSAAKRPFHSVLKFCKINI